MFSHAFHILVIVVASVITVVIVNVTVVTVVVIVIVYFVVVLIVFFVRNFLEMQFSVGRLLFKGTQTLDGRV